MWISRNAVLFLLCVFVTKIVAQQQDDEETTCIENVEGGADSETATTCSQPSLTTMAATSVLCDDIPSEWCQSKKSLYSYGGGSAQAYVPNAPIKSAVCNNAKDDDDDLVRKQNKHKVATWFISRSTRRGIVPKLSVKAKLWSCSSSTNTAEEVDCCCSELSSSSSAAANNDQHEVAAKAEVWQARPDGTYSTLRSGGGGVNNGECRATIVSSQNGTLQFTTLAPGSTGSLGGMGPSSSWDVPPFGPPVIHMLITADNHEPLLIHVPIIPQAKTLEQRGFWGGDWRLHVVGRSKFKSDPYNVTSWDVPNDDGPGESTIAVELDIFLTRSVDNSSLTHDLTKELCPSFLPGAPSWFWVEPIAVCAPSLLHFFPL